MKQTVRRRGFTLAELLIVVVIIGILAALIIPRFLNQSKRAEIAEALQMLGAMRRAAVSYQSAGGPSLQLDESSSSDLDWKKFGMNNPRLSRLWVYHVLVNSAGTAYLYAFYRASESSGGSGPSGMNAYMRLMIAADGTQSWNCTGDMKPLYSSSDSTMQIGCQF